MECCGLEIQTKITGVYIHTSASILSFWFHVHVLSCSLKPWVYIFFLTCHLTWPSLTRSSPLASITIRNLWLYTTNENWEVIFIASIPYFFSFFQHFNCYLKFLIRRLLRYRLSTWRKQGTSPTIKNSFMCSRFFGSWISFFKDFLCHIFP